MNREERMRLIMEDEKRREQEETNRLLKIRNLIESGLPLESIEDDFQTGLVEVETGFETIFELSIHSDRAAVVKYIGNDWYPGVEYEFLLDGEAVGGLIEREVAPTENPLSTTLLARDNIRWRARNVGSEPRDLGVVTGGHFIPVGIYEEMESMFTEFDNEQLIVGGDDATDFIEMGDF